MPLAHISASRFRLAAAPPRDRVFRRLAVLSCFSMLAGCAAFSYPARVPIPAAPAPESEESRLVIELIGYTQRVAAM